MRIFVTGATGLLGNNLIRPFRDKGHDVTGLVRSSQKARWLLGDTGWVEGDMRDVASFAAALDGCDAVFHTAAYFREYYAAREATTRRWIRSECERNAGAASRRPDPRGVRRYRRTPALAGAVEAAPPMAPPATRTRPPTSSRGTTAVKSKVDGDAAMPRPGGRATAWRWSILPRLDVGPGDAAPTGAGQVALDFLRRPAAGHPSPAACPPSTPAT